MNRDYISRVAQVLHRACGFSQLPAHVVYRTAALAGGKEIVFADSDVDIDRSVEPNALRGAFVIFTDAMVIQLQLEGTTSQPSYDSNTVAGRTWSRRGLVSVELLPTASDAEWRDQQGGLPPKAQVALRYERGETVQLPLSGGGRVGTDALLPSIVQDVATGHQDAGEPNG